MVMMCEPLAKAIEDLSKERTFDEIIFLTPDGELFNQKTANSLSLKKNLLLICGTILLSCNSDKNKPATTGTSDNAEKSTGDLP